MPSGSKYHGTADEISFIEGLGTFYLGCETSHAEMLRRYISYSTRPLPKILKPNVAYKANWGEVDGKKAISVAYKRLREVEG